MNQQLAYKSPPQPQQNGDQTKDQQEQETSSQQFSWITDTIVVNGNPVRVIFPDQETTH